MKKQPELSRRLARLGKLPSWLGIRAVKFRLLLAPILFASIATKALALPPGFVDELVTGGTDQPTAMTFAPDGRLFITEQGGSVRVVKDGGLLAAPFVRLTVDSTGERGLLGVALHPDFAANGFVYLYHTVPGSPPHNRVSRLTANGDVAQPGSKLAILDLDGLSDAKSHNGGAIHFGMDGKLYVAVGDNTKGSNAQSLDNRLGKILRINADGSIPRDNPSVFPGVSGRTAGDNRAIWAVGLRNPYTFAFQRDSEAMLINDVGERRFEEINRGWSGHNYGWPASEGPTSIPWVSNPIYAYGHFVGTPRGCAITGGTFYSPRRTDFPISYLRKYFFADFCGGWIYYLNPAAPSTATLFHAGLNKPIDMAVGPGGALYYVQRGNGQLRRIEYTGESAQAIVVSTAQLAIGEGDRAVIMVRLAKQPKVDREVTVDPYLSAASITASTAKLKFTPSNWRIAQRLSIVAAQDPDAADDGATIRLASPGALPTNVRVTVVDDDRPAGSPRAIISLPRNGDTVSGATAEFFGDGLDDGTLDRAVFLVDGVKIYVDPKNRSGHFHVGSAHSRWDTTRLDDGDHLLTLRVYDAQGRWGAHNIKVKVRN